MITRCSGSHKQEQDHGGNGSKQVAKSKLSVNWYNPLGNLCYYFFKSHDCCPKARSVLSKSQVCLDKQKNTGLSGSKNQEQDPTIRVDKNQVMCDDARNHVRQCNMHVIRGKFNTVHVQPSDCLKTGAACDIIRFSSRSREKNRVYCNS